MKCGQGNTGNGFADMAFLPKCKDGEMDKNVDFRID